MIEAKKINKMNSESIALDGTIYNPSLDEWFFTDGTRNYIFKFDIFYEYLDISLINIFKKVLSYIIETKCISTAAKKYFAIKSFIKYSFLKNSYITYIELPVIINYLNSNNSNNNKKNILDVLTTIKKLKLYGVSENISKIIKRVKIRNQISGMAIITKDPERGPYTEQEFQNLCDAINLAYENKKIDLKIYIISLLFNIFGLRPRQIAWLKISDIIKEYNNNELFKYYITIPRDKQGHIEPRVEFTKRPLEIQLATLLNIWINKVKKDYNLHKFKDEIDLSDLPLFPDWSNCIDGILRYHPYVHDIYFLFAKKLKRKIAIKSHRTGKKLNIFPRRSRYYKGTIMAINGCSRIIIAQSLDHSNLQSCKSYILFGQKAVAAINKGVAPYHKQIIDAFKGKIFERQNIKGTIQTYNPVRSTISDTEIGFCVQPSGCTIFSKNGDPETFIARVPFACYRCPNFNAFDCFDEHKKNLSIIKNEKKMHLKSFKSDDSSNQPIMAIHYDPIIRAIKEVLKKIADNKMSIYNIENDNLIDSW